MWAIVTEQTRRCVRQWVVVNPCHSPNARLWTAQAMSIRKSVWIDSSRRTRADRVEDPYKGSVLNDWPNGPRKIPPRIRKERKFLKQRFFNRIKNYSCFIYERLTRARVFQSRQRRIDFELKSYLKNLVPTPKGVIKCLEQIKIKNINTFMQAAYVNVLIRF